MAAEAFRSAAVEARTSRQHSNARLVHALRIRRQTAGLAPEFPRVRPHALRRLPALA